MTYIHPSASEGLRRRIDATIAASQTDSESSRGRSYYYVQFLDRHRRASYSGKYESIPSEVVNPFHPDSRLRVRIYQYVFINGRVVTFSASVKFRPSGRNLITDVDGAASVLGLKLKNYVSSSFPRRTFRIYGRVSSLRPNESYTVTVPQVVWDGPNLGSIPDHVYTSYSRTWSGTRTPNYSTLKGKGKLPVNSHSVLMIWRNDFGDYTDLDWKVLLPTVYHTGYQNAYRERLGTSDHGTEPSVAHSTSQRNVAISRVRNSAIGETQNLAETAATFNQTLRMMGNTVFRIANAGRNLRRGNFSGAINTLWQGKTPRYRARGGLSPDKSLANNWLELQYGWKPLLSDVRYLAGELAKIDFDGTPVGTARGSATIHSSERRPLVTNASPAVVVGWTAERRSTRTSFGLRFRVQDHFRALASQTGFTNPISLAWELLPFSFVVDWFFPIGHYLESLDSWGGLVLLDGWETNFTRVEKDFRRHYSGFEPSQTNPPNGIHHTMRGAYNFKAVKLDRVKLTSFPGLELPTLKSPFSFGHVLNGMALLRQVFR